MSDGRKTIFISYSSVDKKVAIQVKEFIPEQFNIWMVMDKIGPGDRVATSIEEGLSGSDYFLIIISEDSNQSVWVKREISTAFDLATRKKLSVVPFLLKEVPVPFRIQRSNIDARKSLLDGLHRVKDFFIKQLSRVSELEPREILLKSDSDVTRKRLHCNQALRALSLGDLRYHVSERLTIEQVEVIWFDLFHRKIVRRGAGSQRCTLCC